MRRTLTRLTLGAVLTVGSLGAFAVAAPPGHALGPEGCVAQGANGFLAVGTVTGTSSTPPGATPPAATCTYTVSSYAGWGGNDSASWSVAVDTAHAAAADLSGMPCNWVANPLTGTSTASGSGQASGGYGCILPGGSGTASAG